MRAAVFAAGLVVALSAASAGAQPQTNTQTNSIGMTLVRIEPGKMQVGVFKPGCSNSFNGVAAAPAAGRAGAAPAAGGGRGGAPRDPRLSWGPDDFAECAKLAAADASNGFSVTLAKPFLIATTEVTQAQWKAVMGSNPSAFQGDKVAEADQHPVERVRWQDAQAFIKALNAKEKTKAYRLPTEFEWEYACRAGGPGQQAWTAIREQGVLGLGFGSARVTGPQPAETPEQYTTRTGSTAKVATKPANGWGLYDMLGNVWEWTADPYNEKLFADPRPGKTGKEHVLKGGGFNSDVKNAICATHDGGPGDGFNVGFRVVKDIG